MKSNPPLPSCPAPVTLQYDSPAEASTNNQKQVYYILPSHFPVHTHANPYYSAGIADT